jgi:hypothetical protein
MEPVTWIWLSSWLRAKAIQKKCPSSLFCGIRQNTLAHYCGRNAEVIKEQLEETGVNEKANSRA